MGWEPLRFVHAAGLWLDHPPCGIGPLPDDLRRIAEDATLTAFDRLIDVAIERQVDFVLLVGDTFDDRDGSLRAHVALTEGCARLAEQAIRVFALPGVADPPLAWRALGQLPENLTCLLARDDEPAAFVREGQLVTTIARAETARLAHLHVAEPHRSRADSSRRHPFAIGLGSLDAVNSACGSDESGVDHVQSSDAAGVAAGAPRTLRDLPFDYLALGGPGRRQTIHTRQGLAHHPGPLQGLCRAQTGQHGFVIVEVDAAGVVHKKFIPAAPLRWEQFTLEIGPETSREALLTMMRRELAAFRTEPGELLWRVVWNVGGNGPLAEMLADESSHGELWRALAVDTTLTAPVRHALRLVHARAAVPPDTDAASPLDFAGFHTELPLPTADDLAATLRIDPAGPADAADPAGPARQLRLRSLAPHLVPQQVEEETARLGSLLFSQT